MSAIKAMIKVKQDLAAIGKNQKNQAQKFNFRGIDDIYNYLHPLFAKHGLICVSNVMEREAEIRTVGNGKQVQHVRVRVMYSFYAEDGSCLQTNCEGEAMDYGDKATSKALAIAHKYALIQMLMIPTQDMIDPDFQAYEMEKGEITGEPVDMSKIAKAAARFKAIINDEEMQEEEQEERIYNGWQFLNNDERLKVSKMLTDKANGTNRQYRRIIDQIVKNYTPKAEVN